MERQDILNILNEYNKHRNLVMQREIIKHEINSMKKEFLQNGLQINELQDKQNNLMETVRKKLDELQGISEELLEMEYKVLKENNL